MQCIRAGETRVERCSSALPCSRDQRQTLTAFALAPEPAVQNVNQTLSTLRASLAFQPNIRYGLTACCFETMGRATPCSRGPPHSREAVQAVPTPRASSASSNFNAWPNTRVGLQYVAYDRFNGASTAHDVPGGRRAADNNTLHVFMWLAFQGT